ncbi:M23 family metallopeptidase [Candidatus Microgenomates bacterium]|nr:MAG: M23 family metallopeptidase [Candidatus Microgenomates bacterium]
MAKIRLLPLDNKVIFFVYSKFLLFWSFLTFFFIYLRKKVVIWSSFFERYKNILVKFFMMKRGRYNRPFLHLTAMVVLFIGVVFAPFLAETYPIFSPDSQINWKSYSASAQEQSVVIGENVFHTSISQKPRDKVITYVVEKGDTLSTVADKFGISTDTIRWANNLTGDGLGVGDELKILPVTGVVHKVLKGDTVYTIAKKYDVDPQQVVDFPFNDFANPETFSLVEGQMIVVPNGVKPSEKPAIRRQTYLVQGPISVSSAGFSWPTSGVISQFSSWYHTALDIAAPVGTPIVAATSGRVVRELSGSWDGGYGTNIYIDNGGGYETHYSHMSGFNVNVGDDVVSGKTVIGWIGMTGRTTGPHLHFEVRKNGVLVNPLPYLQ